MKTIENKSLMAEKYYIFEDECRWVAELRAIDAFDVPICDSIASSTWSKSEWFWLLFTYIQFYVVNYYIICVETLIMESSIYNFYAYGRSITVTMQPIYRVLACTVSIKTDANISRFTLFVSLRLLAHRLLGHAHMHVRLRKISFGIECKPNWGIHLLSIWKDFG